MFHRCNDYHYCMDIKTESSGSLTHDEQEMTRELMDGQTDRPRQVISNPASSRKTQKGDGMMN